MRDLRLQSGYENFVRMTVSDFALLLNLVGPQIVVASSVSTLVRMPQELAAGCFHCPPRTLCVLIVWGNFVPGTCAAACCRQFPFQQMLGTCSVACRVSCCAVKFVVIETRLYIVLLSVNYSAGKKQFMLFPNYVCYQ